MSGQKKWRSDITAAGGVSDMVRLRFFSYTLVIIIIIIFTQSIATCPGKPPRDGRENAAACNDLAAAVAVAAATATK